ncbi:MAG: hypothetical protein ORN54_05025 [Cyclobacteriaceae bacterium]|nr:hypothetical protein [Cyclobacteriaceae bacterium]
MKNYKVGFGLFFSLFYLLIFSSCEHRVEVKTRVHENGSLDKTIVLHSKQPKQDTQNYFGISAKEGWEVSIDSLQPSTSSKKDSSKREAKYTYSFSKSFQSADIANLELATSSDSLFRLTSKFEKKFRWFYTTYVYSDTYHAINRFKLSTNDYLTEVDFEFINNLPAEGKPISKADSLFLNKLNERIFDHYVNRAYFEEYFQLLIDLANAAQREKLLTHQEAIYELLSENDSKLDNDPWPSLLDSLGIDIDISSSEYGTRKARVEKKFDFMSWASEGKYNHTIAMEGEIVKHNADSVAGNEFYWTPSYLKFAFKDYTFFAETRKPNILAWVLSIFVLLAAVWGLRKKM